ncbi:MAG TPA: hypothetical protein VMU00_08895 [Steroidobacteraceae bacterium]|nr:hypothetical protein [Steroidobacteraceae bacterium]
MDYRRGFRRLGIALSIGLAIYWGFMLTYGILISPAHWSVIGRAALYDGALPVAGYWLAYALLGRIL